jgi:hypothetical protein
MPFQPKERAKRVIRPFRRRLTALLCMGWVFVWTLSASNPCQAIEVTIREVGDAGLTPAVAVVKTPGDVVAFEVVVDTEGQALSGYSFGIFVTPGTVSGISEAQLPLPPLMNLGLPTIDEAAGTISGIAQVGFFGDLPAGIYVTDRIEFLVDSIPPEGIVISAGFHAPNESFIVSGESCPGTAVGCTVTFNSIMVVGGPSVPMLSPVGTSLLICMLLLATARRLGPSIFNRGASNMRGFGYGFTVLVMLISFLPATGPLRAAEKPNQQAAATLDAASPELAETWGIEVVAIRLTGVNRFLDFRYRVVDAEKAERLFGPGIKPVLVDPGSGTVSKVPVPPKLGPMKSTRGKPYEKRQYFVFFANQGRSIRSGQEVAVDFGDLRISGLKVQ